MDQAEFLRALSTAQQCQQCLVEPCTCQLSEVKRRIQDSAENAIRSLLEQQQKLKAMFNERNDLLGQLPVEVTIHVFEFCANHTTFSSVDQILALPSKKPFHLTLGEVCHTWRHIVRSYPRFWKEIPIFLQPSATSPAQAAFFQEWIHRSGQLPLSVWIELKIFRFKPPDMGVAARIFDPLIPILNSVAHRWSFFYAKIPSTYVRQLRLENEQRPQLKVLILRSLADHQAGIESRQFDLGVKVCPEVLQVARYELQNMQLEWNNLTCFHGLGLSLVDCIGVFEWAPQLLKCNLTHVLFTSMPSTKHVVTNHTVETFLIDNHEEIFDFLILPALRELHCGLSDDSFADVLSDFIARSGCKLEAAAFCESSGDDHDLLEFLSLVPSLKRLSLSDSQIGHTFLSRLGETSFIHDEHYFSHLLPHLQHFDFRYSCYSWQSYLLEWSSVTAMCPIIPPQHGIVRRPLSSIYFEIEPANKSSLVPGMVGWPENWSQLIDRESLKKMLDIIDSGVDLRIIQKYYHYDIIQVSKEYHRLGVDEPKIDLSLFEFTVI